MERLRDAGQRINSQRTAIMEAFFAANHKVTAEELRARLRARGVNASLNTVGRSLKALSDHGLATVHRVRGGQSRFEPAAHERRYQGRFVCTRCRTAVEFAEALIERIEETLARKRNFEILAHRLEFYGLCEKCRDAEGSAGVR